MIMSVWIKKEIIIGKMTPILYCTGWRYIGEGRSKKHLCCVSIHTREVFFPPKFLAPAIRIYPEFKDEIRIFWFERLVGISQKAYLSLKSKSSVVLYYILCNNIHIV